jgi:rhodanese-related sulfurtransferase
MFPFLFKSDVKSINVNEIDSMLGKINLIDIREPYEYKAGHLPTAKNIPMDKIISEAGKYLDGSKEYYIICHSGARSSRASSALKRMGYNVTDVKSGTGRYRGKLEK